MRITMILLLHGNDSVIAFFLLFLALFPFNDAYDPAFKRRPGKAGSSIKTSASTGSPSSALVEGTNPKS